MTDIASRTDIVTFVDAFYTEVQVDELLGPVFLARFGTDGWTAHLERMYTFWNTILFHEPGYKGSPFQKHLSLPIEARHFERWLSLFSQTIDARFAGSVADEAKQRAQLMGTMFKHKLAYFRENPQQHPLA